MRLVKQIVLKKLESFDEGLINNENRFWDFYFAYNLARAVLRLSKVDFIKRNRLWKKIIKEKDKEKSIELLKGFVDEDRNVVSQFMVQVEGVEEEEMHYTNFYEKGVIGVLSYELE